MKNLFYILFCLLFCACARQISSQQILTPPYPVDTVASYDYHTVVTYVNQPEKYTLLARVESNDYLVYEKPIQEKSLQKQAKKVKRKNTQEITTESGGTTIYVGKGGTVDYNWQSPETEAPEVDKSKHVQKQKEVSNNGFIWIGVAAILCGLVYLLAKILIPKLPLFRK